MEPMYLISKYDGTNVLHPLDRYPGNMRTVLEQWEKMKAGGLTGYVLERISGHVMQSFSLPPYPGVELEKI